MRNEKTQLEKDLMKAKTYPEKIKKIEEAIFSLELKRNLLFTIKNNLVLRNTMSNSLEKQIQILKKEKNNINSKQLKIK